MLDKKIVNKARERAAAMLADAGIVITPAEAAAMEIVDFGLNQLESQGLEIVVYINTEIYCAKELVLFPHQTCPEHRHPDRDGKAGKMETFRCRTGEVLLYIEGEKTARIQARVPAGSEAFYTVFHEVVLNPGEQFTIPSDTLHWFQAGEEGAIVSEFSSTSHDDSDIFTDTNIKRVE